LALWDAFDVTEVVDTVGEVDGFAIEQGIPWFEFFVGVEVLAGTVRQTNPQLETDNRNLHCDISWREIPARRS
jgi:hypothetical protein